MAKKYGLAWTNNCVRRGECLAIADPGDTPQVTGGKRQIMDALQKAIRMNNGNDWSSRLFVLDDGEWRVISREDFCNTFPNMADIRRMARRNRG